MAEFKILKTWELETNANHLLHEKSSEYYSRMNLYFMLPIMILSSSTGTLGALNVDKSQFMNVNGINIISVFIAIFGFVTAILTTIHNLLNIQKLEANHNYHAVEYSKISKEIKLHIFLSDTDMKVYSNMAEYIKQCKQKIDKLIESAPMIPYHVENSLDSKLKELRDSHSGEIDELITLVTRNSDEIVLEDMQKSITSDVKITVIDTIDSNNSCELNENKHRIVEEILNEESPRISDEDSSTDNDRKSLDIFHKITNIAARETFKEGTL